LNGASPTVINGWTFHIRNIHIRNIHIRNIQQYITPDFEPLM
jgi:hypothetical protein